MKDEANKLASAILLAFATAAALCVFGILLGKQHDFRAIYFYFQAIGLGVMLITGIRGGSARYGFAVIIASLSICALIDLWLSLRGPIYIMESAL